MRRPSTLSAPRVGDPASLADLFFQNKRDGGSNPEPFISYSPFLSLTSPSSLFPVLPPSLPPFPSSPSLFLLLSLILSHACTRPHIRTSCALSLSLSPLTAQLSLLFGPFNFDLSADGCCLNQTFKTAQSRYNIHRHGLESHARIKTEPGRTKHGDG